MADVKYNVSQLFKDAFGINSPVFITQPFTKDKPANISFKGLEVVPDYYESDSRSWMGTPIVFSAKFEGGNYRRYKANGQTEIISMQGFTLPPATMFSFRRAKNITRTNVLGSNGTVKEIYGFDDWVIDVRGLCLDEPNRSAAEQIETLLLWEELADGINVSGKLFSQHKIDRVAVSDWSDNVTQGKPGVVPFSFQMYSDDPLEMLYQ